MFRPRPGYTRSEVAVSAAVAVVTVGLLVPAVMKVRAAAARSRCGNNLRLVGAAALAYHDARGHLPPGGGATPNPAAPNPPARETGWTWAYALLPYLGEGDLYRNPDPEAVRRTPVAVYLCPARHPGGAVYDWAKLDYAANAGADATGLTGLIAPTGADPVRLAGLRNGVGGAVVVAEKRLNREALGASRDDDDAYPTAGWGDDHEVYRTAAEPPAADVSAPGDLAPRTGFGSSHAGVFQVGFADGSVRPLRYVVDPDLWRRACHRDGSPAPPGPTNQ